MHSLIVDVLHQDAEGAEDSNASDASEEATLPNSTSTASKPPVATRKETKTRQKTFRVALIVAGPGFALPAMNADQLKVLAQLTCMKRKDKRKEKSTPSGVITEASCQRGSPGLLL